MQKVCSVKVGYPKMAKLAETCHKYTKSLILTKKKVYLGLMDNFNILYVLS